MSGRKLTCKQLESHLQDVDEFDRPQVRLEQYATPPHIAAQILTTIEDVYGDIRDKLVADLGCGTGRLTIGSIMCAARMVYGFDIDSNALDATLRNISDIFTEDDEQNKTDCIASNAHRYCPNFNLVQVDVTSNHSNDKLWEPWHKMFDTVILNPPFGTKETQGLDLKFVHRAIQISNNSVYSLHKTSTRNVGILNCPYNKSTLIHTSSNPDIWKSRPLNRFISNKVCLYIFSMIKAY